MARGLLHRIDPIGCAVLGTIGLMTMLLSRYGQYFIDIRL